VGEESIINQLSLVLTTSSPVPARARDPSRGLIS
jgi:hypothetical protein